MTSIAHRMNATSVMISVRSMRLVFWLFTAAALLAAPPSKVKTENVIFVMTDGLRWQEVFGGVDEKLIGKDKAYWRETAPERRALLMPFFWSVIAKEGQVYGNPALGSRAHVTNSFFFSYPGYNETLTGFADPRIDSNDKNPNPNVTVFEWLHRKPAFRGKVAAFGAWDTFPFIFNAERAGFPVNAGAEPFTPKRMTPQLALLNQIKGELPALFSGEAFDALPFQTALEYMKEFKPRLLFLSLGDTDALSHAGNYPEYTRAAHRADAYLKQLWEAAQSMSQYRGKTTLIFTTDHGRGEAPVDWKGHGQKVPDSKEIWMAFLGPDTPALGERSKVAAVTQSQLAATVAALLGEDYAGEVPKAGKPIKDVMAQQ